MLRLWLRNSQLILMHEYLKEKESCLTFSFILSETPRDGLLLDRTGINSIAGPRRDLSGLSPSLWLSLPLPGRPTKRKGQKYHIQIHSCCGNLVTVAVGILSQTHFWFTGLFVTQTLTGNGQKQSSNHCPTALSL